MTQLRSAAPLAASAVLTLALLVTGRASALDCEKGFVAQEVPVSDCAEPAPACPPDAECKPAPQPEPCQPQVELQCVPAPCSSNAECGADMVCHEFTDTCPSVGCACPSTEPDCACDVPACDPKTTSVCTPKYELPCTVAADCGAGFDCVQLMNGGCSGSSGSGGGADPMPGDAARPLPPEGVAGAPASEPLPPECTIEPSGDFMCVPKKISCDTDAECLAGWTCVGDDDGVSTPACDGGGDCFAAPEPDPQPVAKHCQPKYYRGGTGDDDLGTPTSGGPKGSNGGTQNPEAAPSSDSNESSSCQMGHAPASRGALALLAMLGALVGLSRRRAQPRA